MRRALSPFAILAVLGLSACAADGFGGDVAGRGAYSPDYGPMQTLLLDGDLVNFRYEMRGARDRADVDAYGRCAAAQYALIRGFGFARHVRTQIAQSGGNWRGDAVYTISPDLPKGVVLIDAEVTVRDCGAQGIPTV